MVVTLIAFAMPRDLQPFSGGRFDRSALVASLASRDLWVYGIALLGGYGAYFTTSQLFTTYATQDRHLSVSSGGLLSALILLAGIPGSLLGGWWADRSKNLRLFVMGPLVIVAVLLALIPAVPTGALWVLGIGIGFFLIFGFAAWLAVPTRVCNIDHAYIGTATGLMLTLGGHRRILHPHPLRSSRSAHELRDGLDGPGGRLHCLRHRRDWSATILSDAGSRSSPP
jgi:ACS family D-galactonate transporter-like MFS transporter